MVGLVSSFTSQRPSDRLAPGDCAAAANCDRHFRNAQMAILLVKDMYRGLILGLRPTNERRRYFVTTSLIGWVQFDFLFNSFQANNKETSQLCSLTNCGKRLRVMTSPCVHLSPDQDGRDTAHDNFKSIYFCQNILIRPKFQFGGVL